MFCKWEKSCGKSELSANFEIQYKKTDLFDFIGREAFFRWSSTFLGFTRLMLQEKIQKSRISGEKFKNVLTLWCHGVAS